MSHKVCPFAVFATTLRPIEHVEQWFSREGVDVHPGYGLPGAPYVCSLRGSCLPKGQSFAALTSADFSHETCLDQSDCAVCDGDSHLEYWWSPYKLYWISLLALVCIEVLHAVAARLIRGEGYAVAVRLIRGEGWLYLKYWIARCRPKRKSESIGKPTQKAPLPKGKSIAKAPAPPPPKAKGKAKGKAAPKAPVAKARFRNRLRWTPVESLEGTVFDAPEKSTLTELDIEMLHATFDEPKSKPVMHRTLATNRERTCLLDSKRAHTLGIIFRRCPVPFDTLCKSLKDCDFSLALHEEDILHLLKEWPTSAELALVREYVETHAPQLSARSSSSPYSSLQLRDVELHLLKVALLPSCKMRLRLLLLAKQREALHATCIKSCSLVRNACETLMASHHWHTLLKHARSVANFINGVDDGVSNFNFNALQELDKFKGAAGVSALHCLCRACSRECPDFGKQLLGELAGIEDASTKSVNTLFEQVRKLEDDLSSLISNFEEKRLEFREAAQLQTPRYEILTPRKPPMVPPPEVIQEEEPLPTPPITQSVVLQHPLCIPSSPEAQNSTPTRRTSIPKLQLTGVGASSSAIEPTQIPKDQNTHSRQLDQCEKATPKSATPKRQTIPKLRLAGFSAHSSAIETTQILQDSSAHSRQLVESAESPSKSLGPRRNSTPHLAAVSTRNSEVETTQISQDLNTHSWQLDQCAEYSSKSSTPTHQTAIPKLQLSGIGVCSSAIETPSQIPVPDSSSESSDDSDNDSDTSPPNGTHEELKCICCRGATGQSSSFCDKCGSCRAQASDSECSSRRTSARSGEEELHMVFKSSPDTDPINSARASAPDGDSDLPWRQQRVGKPCIPEDEAVTENLSGRSTAESSTSYSQQSHRDNQTASLANRLRIETCETNFPQATPRTQRRKSIEQECSRRSEIALRSIAFCGQLHLKGKLFGCRLCREQARPALPESIENTEGAEEQDHEGAIPEKSPSSISTTSNLNCSMQSNGCTQDQVQPNECPISSHRNSSNAPEFCQRQLTPEDRIDYLLATTALFAHEEAHATLEDTAGVLRSCEEAFLQKRLLGVKAGLLHAETDTVLSCIWKFLADFRNACREVDKNHSRWSPYLGKPSSSDCIGDQLDSTRLGSRNSSISPVKAKSARRKTL